MVGVLGSNPSVDTYLINTSMKIQLNRFFPLLVSAMFVIFASSCGDDDSIIKRVEPGKENNQHEFPVTTLVDAFVIGAFENYYLWSDEEGRNDLVESVLDVDTCMHPLITYKKVLHPDDRWTILTDDYQALLDFGEGIETTAGMDLIPMRYSANSDSVLFVVSYVLANSPAEEAGIKRGDVFTRFNGKHVTMTNYMDFYSNDKTFTLGYGKVIRNEKKIIDLDNTISLTPIKLYEEPVLATNIFEFNGKKVGYLAYQSFTQDVNNLTDAFRSFKEACIEEIIVDLRYNSGGYVSTANALASMLAPVSVVEAEKIITKNVYNEVMTVVYKDALEYHFNKKYLEVNPDVKKIYFLTSENTASASEITIVSLLPYTDVTIIGETTHGKFCSGIMIDGKYVYKADAWNEYKDKISNWGMYIMIGTYSDCNGNNPCRPNGIKPDIIAEEDLIEAIPLGDENERLLRVALEYAGKDYPVQISTSTRSTAHRDMITLRVERPSMAILTN